MSYIWMQREKEVPETVSPLTYALYCSSWSWYLLLHLHCHPQALCMPVPLPIVAVLGWFPCKADSKGESPVSFAELLCIASCQGLRLPWRAGILCACTWVLFRFQQLKFCCTAMVLGGRSQEPVYPSVVPLRSYSSLNLQQVASCDFIFTVSQEVHHQNHRPQHKKAIIYRNTVGTTLHCY